MFCKDCKFWSKDDQECSLWSISDEKRPYTGMNVPVYDDDYQGPHAKFKTEPNFGCVLFNRREEKKVVE